MKFPLNTHLKIVKHTEVFEEIIDESERLKGEWLGVEKEKDTVYVFSAFLSFEPIYTGLKMYYASPCFREWDNKILSVTSRWTMGCKLFSIVVFPNCYG